MYRPDAEQWRRERERIFARSWQYLAHESQLARPRQYVAETLAGYPVLALRDDQGELQAFHNVCRHRAGPLTDDGAGTCPGQLVCKYHGWVYTLDGRLRAARDFGPSADFDPRQYGLLPLRIEVWRGLVFVCLDPDAAPLSEWVAPLERRLAGRDWSALRLVTVRHHEMACNWKTYVENYLEGYHVPLVHAALDAEIDSSRYQVTMDERVAIHEAPLRAPNPVYDGLWAWMWPTLGVNVYGVGLMIERMNPLGPARVRLDYIYLMPPGVEVSDETMAISDVVTAEDVGIVEAVQRNLDAGVYDTGRLSPRHEGAVAAFQSFVTEALA
jgi:choline monooxygenase